VSTRLETMRPEAFAAAREQFATILGWLDGEASSGLDHAELEGQLDVAGRELLRLLLQDHVDLRAVREARVEVAGADGSHRTRVETGHTRALGTIFGEITVTRIAYREPGQANLHPADAALNLPVEKHSHGLRQLAAIESSRGSFDGAVEAIERSTGQHLGKRQVEDLASRAAIDFDAFYTQHKPPSSDVDDVLVLSCDGKGVMMRPDALRPATAKAAANSNPKLATRLSKGEKRNRKRMAEVGAVYDITPVSRCPADILPGNDTQRRDTTAAPVARNKWLTASVVNDAATVVTAIFDEADRRDPDHARSCASKPKPKTAASPWRSSSTSCTSWNTSGRQPGPSTARATQLPRPGSVSTPTRSWTVTRPASPVPSDEPPPSPTSTPAAARTPTSARPT